MDNKALRGLLNPIRMKILQTILKNNTATVKMIAEELPDISSASLYRHIKKMIEDNIIEVCEENKIRGTVEKVYKLKENPFEQIEKEVKEYNPEGHFNLFYSFVMALISDFQNYLSEDNYDLEMDGVGFRSYPIYLNEEEMTEFIDDFRKLLLKYVSNEPINSRTLRKFSYVMMPGKDQ